MNIRSLHLADSEPNDTLNINSHYSPSGRDHICWISRLRFETFRVQSQLGVLVGVSLTALVGLDEINGYAS